MTKTTIRAVIFDFDGLIIDTESVWFEALSVVYKRYGADLPHEDFLRLVGTSLGEFNPYEHLSRVASPYVSADEASKQASEIHSQIMSTRDLRPGVRAYLDAAKALGLRIGLASSSHRKWIDRYLQRFELGHYFEVIRTSDDVANVKPDPELYTSALKALEVTPAEAVAFEDSANGARAAAAAGMRLVIVPNEVTSQLTFDCYDIRLDSMEERELSSVIDQLQGG